MFFVKQTKNSLLYIISEITLFLNGLFQLKVVLFQLYLYLIQKDGFIIKSVYKKYYFISFLYHAVAFQQPMIFQ